MPTAAKAPFTIRRAGEPEHDRMEVLLGRRPPDKVYTGDLSGTAAGEMLSAGGAHSCEFAWDIVKR